MDAVLHNERLATAPIPAVRRIPIEPREATQFGLSDRRPLPFAGRHNTRDHIALFGEYPPHPIDDGTHAGGAAYIAMNDHPVRGGEVGDWRGQPFEEGMAVADITG